MRAHRRLNPTVIAWGDFVIHTVTVISNFRLYRKTKSVRSRQATGEEPHGAVGVGVGGGLNSPHQPQ